MGLIRIDRYPLPVYPVGSNEFTPKQYPWITDQSLILNFQENWAMSSGVFGPVANVVETTRESTGTYFDANGVMRTAANNVWRRDHDPVTGAPLGVLIEEARTNLLVHSSEFEHTAWSKPTSFVSADGSMAPDGTLTARKLIADTSSGAHTITQTQLVAANTVVTSSVFAKAGERDSLYFRCADPAFIGRAFFNLATGTLGTKDAGILSHLIEPVGGGWFRCSVTFPTGASGTRAGVEIGIGPVSFQGDGVSGLYIWGAQTEVGAFPTSYTPTATAAATRAADILTTPIAGWLNPSVGSVRLRARTGVRGNLSSLMQIDDGTNNTGWRIYRAVNGVLYLQIFSSGASVGSVLLGFVDDMTSFGLAWGWDGAGVAVSLNGAAPISLPVAIPVLALTTLRIGKIATAQFWNDHMSTFAYYPRRLSDTELQAAAVLP